MCAAVVVFNVRLQSTSLIPLDFGNRIDVLPMLLALAVVLLILASLGAVAYRRAAPLPLVIGSNLSVAPGTPSPPCPARRSATRPSRAPGIPRPTKSSPPGPPAKATPTPPPCSNTGSPRSPPSSANPRPAWPRLASHRAVDAVPNCCAQICRQDAKMRQVRQDLFLCARSALS